MKHTLRRVTLRFFELAITKLGEILAGSEDFFVGVELGDGYFFIFNQLLDLVIAHLEGRGGKGVSVGCAGCF